MTKELTKTQAAIMECLVAGLSQKQIAIDMGISPKTVNAHLYFVRRKLGGKTSHHAAVIYDRQRRAEQWQ